MSLKGVAKETLKILEAGAYSAPSGRRVRIGAAQRAAEAGTVLYRPDQLRALLRLAGASVGAPEITVTEEQTQDAARRLSGENVALLNFASARNPGGGFIRGARAQEEDLARCSGLYSCLQRQMAYYQANRGQSSLLYTDHMIYSPAVPFFRVRSRDLLEEAFTASIITAPAPNAGALLRKRPGAGEQLAEALRRRAGMVLALARDQGHRTLVLGAWGCGVFANQPQQVADAFGAWLEGAVFVGCFDRVVFAILARGRKGEANLAAFQRRFG